MSHGELSSVGVRIRVIRGKLGVGEFAEALGLNRKTVTRWEADDSLPDGPSLLLLLEKFGADPSWVLTGRGAGLVLDDEEQMLLTRYRNSTPSLRDAALRVLLGGAETKAGNSTVIHGNVGPRIEGDLTLDTMTINMGNKYKK